LQIGIIGLPAAGKSTVFNALTGAKAPTGGYSGRDQPSVAVVSVPDERIDMLVPLFSPKKTIYAAVEFVDIAGVGTGAEAGQGFSPSLLAAARHVDAFAFVLGAFDRPERVRDDLEEIELELNYADQAVIERRLDRLAADLKKSPTSGRPAIEAERTLMGRLNTALQDGAPVRDLQLEPDERKVLRGFGFLTEKPTFVILNVSEDVLAAGEPAADLGLPMVAISGEIEAEIAELEPEDAKAFLADLNVVEQGINRVIREAYRTARLISFFTVGPDEVRAWTITEGATALEAADVIHTDIARGLIRAEVVAYDDMLRVGTMAEARRQGVLRLESKAYVVKDGEICHFLSNV